jgi:arginine decarboxylase
MRRPEDRFLYDVVVVPSFQDALIAASLNTNLQAVVVRYGFPFKSKKRLEVLDSLSGFDESAFSSRSPTERSGLLAAALHGIRPELDLYLVTDASVEESAGFSDFKRVFYRQEDYIELHLSILRGVQSRNRTPFFKALRRYAEQPTGVFHAMPISRGKSIFKSHWIQDMAQFYGTNIFLAETSATSGGLDSLLDPHGPIKEAQELAARAFGARRSFFVTNGTTAANKIVVQTLVRPGDIVLVDRDCHKSHHYALTLAGAEVVYLDAYPLHAVSMYGAVPTAEIRSKLLELKEAGKLDRVRLLILTNCTFDGIVYHPQRLMEECLAIKPDLVFLWDEAWFGFARFSPTYRQRTAMYAAQALQERFRSAAYRDLAAREPDRHPDPDAVRVRVYATQSTHKTLTALRQGSMIHVHDQDFHSVDGAFRDAYMTHTSTSPNYQILASLDVGRRQVELEGFELVSRQIELAMTLREKVAANPVIQEWFRFLTIKDLIPGQYRPSGVEAFYDPESGWSGMLDSWRDDEFVLDPTRLTLFIGKTGVDGDTFKKDHLMQRHGIQVNKTTRNTVLFMTNIGTSRSSVAHLIDVLSRLSRDFDAAREEEGPFERTARERRVRALVEDLPPLPDFSRFHRSFGTGDGGTPEGNLRAAYFLGTDEDNCEYLPLDASALDDAVNGGREIVAAGFLTPYPPGFPVLVPGQVLSREILDYLRALDTKEIHGYRPELGLRVFTESALSGA